MSPSLEKYVYKTLKTQPDKIGEVIIQSLPVDDLTATRPFLNNARLNREKRRRAAFARPEVISTSEEYFVVDGHHKVSKVPPGTLIECRVLQTQNARLSAVLERRRAGPVQKLTIK